MEKPSALQLSFIVFLLSFSSLFIMAEESPQVPISDSVDTGEGVMGVNVTRKNEWPEVVGLAAGEAEEKIKEDMPRAHVQVVPPDHFVTMDFNQGRVRVFVDDSGKVAKPPMIG